MKDLFKQFKEIRLHRLAAPFFLLAILAMMILPLPTIVLDAIFTFNIILALIVILVSVTVRRPLEFAVFPTIILFATLLRLTLNVASTRIVLLSGHEGSGAAGQVIESFGQVVIGGNFVVGLVVFIILMIINFLVITKGAERISEVTARFTLDAMPGKQMAIDADLNSGLINQEKAQERRKEITREADFYGAMDGTSKFVRGDAIAGILILIINIVGGTAIGTLVHDLNIGEAFKLYALLTIGDGLVAQIPSLLLAAAAAIVVTRINDDKSDGLEQQVSSQLLASPTVLYGASGVMFILAIIPGMPWIPFITFSLALGFAAWKLGKSQTLHEPAELQDLRHALEQSTPTELDWEQLSNVVPLSIKVGYGLIDMIDPKKGASLIRRISGMRRNISDSMGIIIPNISIKESLSLSPFSYSILLYGVEISHAELQQQQLMAIPSSNVYGELDGLPSTDPAYGMRVIWIRPDNKSHAVGLGYQVVDHPTIISTHIDKIIKQHLSDLFTHDDVSALLDRLAINAPKLRDAIEKIFTHSHLKKIFCRLLSEQISLKNIVCIASTLVEYSDTSTDPILLSSEVRSALRREIVYKLNGNKTDLHAFNISNDLEGMLLSSLQQAQQNGKVVLDNFPISPNILSQLQNNLPPIVEKMKEQFHPPILLVAPQLRPLLSRYSRLLSPDLNVLSYNEIPERHNVIFLGSLG
ncbi:flagellar biosynthesis protein FlhA [Chromobacterium amazonense]|uniref:flagellar biosynthesis protein FlhA n=1 Tax=Chromobacterium amazonense TaxID=1382803 RepID=UPI0031F693BD